MTSSWAHGAELFCQQPFCGANHSLLLPKNAITGTSLDSDRPGAIQPLRLRLSYFLQQVDELLLLNLISFGFAQASVYNDRL